MKKENLMKFAISSDYINKPYSFYTPTLSLSQVSRNAAKISYLALPIITSCFVNMASAGIVSYTACIASCETMAAAAAPGLAAYTFAACQASCVWLLSPSCP